MPRAEPVLICALSGRALAQSARAAGFAPIVLDAFADLDTRTAAASWQRVPLDASWRFRHRALLAAARRLAPPPVPLVWGSGFEHAPDQLAELAEGRPLWGNTPQAIRATKSPSGFAATTQGLGIPHPPVRARPPADPSGWLCKRAGAAGGGHVRPATRCPPCGRGWYWQRHVPGRAVSALVAGTGSAAQVLGFSEQWAAPLRGRRFRFAGTAAPALLSPAAAACLAAAAAALVTHYRLVGLVSVDALVAGATATVLEINPRPGASLDAYAGGLGLNLFEAHHGACHGELPVVPPSRNGAAGSLIVYAQRTTCIDPAFAWPDWAADRTPPGGRIAAGGPIATVLASADDVPGVRALLTARANSLRGLLDGRALVAPVTPAARRRSSVG